MGKAKTRGRCKVAKCRRKGENNVEAHIFTKSIASREDGERNVPVKGGLLRETCIVGLCFSFRRARTQGLKGAPCEW